MGNKNSVLVVALTFLAGVLVTSLLVWLYEKSSFDWLETSIEKKHFGVSYSTKALFGADIPFPYIKEITGKTKFIERLNDKANVNLGYLVNITQENMDKSKVPEKYLKQKPVTIEGQTVTQEPIDEVTYEVVFSFVLKDKDGFELLEVTSKPETIYSGKRNKLQGVAEQQIPNGIAARVSQAQMKTQVIKCITCE